MAAGTTDHAARGDADRPVRIHAGAAHLAHGYFARVAFAPPAAGAQLVPPARTAAAPQRRFAGSRVGCRPTSHSATGAAGNAPHPGPHSRYFRDALPRALRLQPSGRIGSFPRRSPPRRRYLFFRRAARVAPAVARLPWRHVLQERGAGRIRRVTLAVRARRGWLQPLLHVPRGRIGLDLRAPAASVPAGAGGDLFFGGSVSNRP